MTSSVETYWENVVEKKNISSKDVVCVLRGCLSQHRSLRTFSWKLLHNSNNSISVMFPSVFYNQESFAEILDIIGSLTSQSKHEYSSIAPVICLPHSGIKVPLPCSRAVITEILKLFERFFSECLTKALCQSPKQVLSAFAFYVYSSNKLVKTSSNLEISTITNLGISVFNHFYYSAKIVPFDNFSIIESYLYPEKFHSWVKNHKAEESYLVRDESMLQMQGNYLSIAESLSSDRDFYGLIRKLHRHNEEDKGVETQNSEIFDLMGKATAGMIARDKKIWHPEIVAVPLRISSLASIYAGVFCWDWLISSKPYYKHNLFNELELSCKDFLYRQNFLLHQQPFLTESELIYCHKTKPQLTKPALDSVLIVIEFIQRHIYSSAIDKNSQSHLLKILDQVFEYKLNPHVLDFDSGLEIILRLIITVCDIVKYFSNSPFNKIFNKMIEFSLSGFYVWHKWVKCSTLDKCQFIKDMFEKAIDAIEECKVHNNQQVESLKYAYFNEPLTWQIKGPIDILYSNFYYKRTFEENFAFKKDILLILLYNNYQKFVAWNSGLSQKTISK